MEVLSSECCEGKGQGQGAKVLSQGAIGPPVAEQPGVLGLETWVGICGRRTERSPTGSAEATHDCGNCEPVALLKGATGIEEG